MNYKVSTVNSAKYTGYVALDSAINSAVSHGNAIVYDCINNCIIAVTHKIDGEVYINRLFSDRMMQVNALELRQREYGNMPLLKGDTTLEVMGWKDIS